MEYIVRVFGVDLTYFRGNAFSTFLDLLFALSILRAHFNRPVFKKLPALGLMLSLLIISVVSLLPVALNVRYHLSELFVSLIAFGIYLYVLLCEILVRGGARSLTNLRGSDWTKEIDYIYIALGLFGLGLTVGSSDIAYEKVALPSIFAWILVVTALVLRLIKTRAELNSWNTTRGSKLESYRSFRRDLRSSLLLVLAVTMVGATISIFVTFMT
jgi:hypothetical protein